MRTLKSAGLIAVLLMISGFAFAEKEKEEFTKSYELAPNGSVEVENVNGDVTIEGYTGNSVELTAIKYGDADNFDLVKIDVESTSSRFAVRTVYPKYRNNTDVSVEYRLKVPEGVQLRGVGTVNGDVAVTAVHGRVDAKTVNGSVEVKDARSSLNSSTVNGAIDAAFTDLPSDSAVSLKSVNGSLTVLLPSAASADVDAKTMNGKIECDFPVPVEKSWVSKKLQGRIGNGGANLDAETLNGSIAIKQQ